MGFLATGQRPLERDSDHLLDRRADTLPHRDGVGRLALQESRQTASCVRSIRHQHASQRRRAPVSTRSTASCRNTRAASAITAEDSCPRAASAFCTATQGRLDRVALHHDVGKSGDDFLLLREMVADVFQSAAPATSRNVSSLRPGCAPLQPIRPREARRTTARREFPRAVSRRLAAAAMCPKSRASSTSVR